MTSLALTPRTTIRRLADRQTVDSSALYQLLDEVLVAHVAAVVAPIDAAPIVVPMAFARDGSTILLHGSSGGGFALRSAAGDTEIAVAVTSLDGMVFARSLFDSSMNYRSAVIYGVPTVVPDDEKEDALLALSRRLMPGREKEVRPMTRKELAATQILRLSLDEVSMKRRAGGPSERADDGEDHAVWAGVVPIRVAWGEPEPSGLSGGMPPSPSVIAAMTRSARSDSA